MNALVFEMSTSEGRLAAVSEMGQAVEEPILTVARGWGNGISETVERVMRQIDWTWDDIGLYVAGRGPGQYSGMRAALTTARTLALPDGRPVRALSSGWALVGPAAEERPDATRIMVVGDARRERVWLGLFEQAGSDWVQTVDWQLATIDEWAALSAEDVLCVSSEWTRLEPLLHAKSAPDRDWLRRNLAPSAVALGRMALTLERANTPRETPLPIYLHPPVAR